ncbi:uncharacterized protein LOC141715078 [Apium graveolens]|uniref:uncharacterized protein LOC141715078 n=1 Tax=Apium graveolens TaxID=4045 RepID=UPI003D7B63A5
MRIRNSKVITTDKEHHVAEILLNLPVLISRPTPGIATLLLSSPFPRIAKLLSSPSWGSKRRRSAVYVDTDVIVNRPATTPRIIASHSPQSLTKPRCSFASKIKRTKQELLNKVDMLTECGDTLKMEVRKVNQYFDKLLTKRSILNAVKHQLKKCHIEEGKTKIGKGSRKCESDSATGFPSQQDMSVMYPVTQSCQALPPKDSNHGGNPGLNMS